MQFVWPIKADYRIAYLDENYEQTIIGRNNRDYVWVMARTPSISEEDYLNLVEVVGSLGYELDALQRATPCQMKINKNFTLWMLFNILASVIFLAIVHS